MITHYAIIRVRGTVNVKPEIRDTLKMLRLERVNHCVIYPATVTIQGMLQKVKDYVTWGEIELETLIQLIKNYGRILGNKPLTDEYIAKVTRYPNVEALAKAILEGELNYHKIENIKPVFRLHPPRKGYRSIKRPYKLGGALGYRGSAINSLILRMLPPSQPPQPPQPPS